MKAMDAGVGYRGSAGSGAASGAGWLNLAALPTISDPAPARLLGWIVVGGIAFDIGIRGGFSNAIVALGFGVLVAMLLADHRARTPQARALLLAALLPAAALGLRASPWLATSNLLAVVGLTGAAIVLARSGSIFDTTPGRLVRRTVPALGRAVAAPLVFRPLLPQLPADRLRKSGRLLLALALTLPAVGALVALLAAADPVFEGLVTPDVSAGPLAGHTILAGFFAAGLLVAAVGAAGDSDDHLPPGRFGTTEVLTMLGLAGAVLGLFVVAQLVALTSAGDRLIHEAGLTPAEYARGGFFQLCWAAALIVAFLAVVGFLAAPDTRRAPSVRALSALVPALAVGLVVVSLRRLALYDDAFGLTMLRLWVVGAALWMGAVLVMIALRNLGLGGDRHWVLGGATVTALALVLLADLANPEAFVVHHNAAWARQDDDRELDLDYLRGLSDDAVPAMVDELGADAFTADADFFAYERDPMSCDDETTGVAALNWGVQQAADARRASCPSGG
jgi:hypothetical protein